MAKSKPQTEGLQFSNSAIIAMGEYADQHNPTQLELQNVEDLLKLAYDKYSEAETDEAGSVEVNEFFKVVKNYASILLDLRKYDDALAMLDNALGVDSLRIEKTQEINDLKLTIAFSKANALTEANENPDDIIDAADIGLTIDPTSEELHYLKARAHLRKDEDIEAIAEFSHVKDSAALGAYTNDTVKALLTNLAIRTIQTGDTFQNFVAGQNIGNGPNDWLTEVELADRVASFARFKFAPTAAQIAEGATEDKTLGCVLMNALIGVYPEANETLHAMVTNGKATSTLLGDIHGAHDPLASDFTGLDWS